MKKTIFLVDDDESVLKMFKLYAEVFLQEYILKTFSSGIEAIDSFKKGQPDVVVTDFNMPGMNGVELAKELRKISSSIKIIMQTGNLEDPLIPKDILEFVDILLWKGNGPKILAETLRDILE